MEKLMEKFESLWMSQKISFTLYCVCNGPSNPEPCVVALYEEYKQLSEEAQEKIRDIVFDWMRSLTREEMFIGAREEHRGRRAEQKAEG